MLNGLRDIVNEYTPEQRAELARRAALALLGLVVGLFIGWVVWPVERDTGTIESLRPEQKAHYLSAVAEAYVASGGQNAESTLARLSGLSDPGVAIADAIRYFQEQDSATSALHQINLRSLATAAQTDESVVLSLQETADDSSTPLRIEEPEIGWLNWILVMLTAVLLTLGGIWIAIQLLRQRERERPVAADDDFFIDANDEAELDDEDEDAQNDLVYARSAAQRMAQWEAMMGSDKPNSPTDRDDYGVVETQPSVIPDPSLTADSPIVMELDMEIEEDEEEDEEDDTWLGDQFDEANSLYSKSDSPAPMAEEDEQEGDAVDEPRQRADDAPASEREDETYDEDRGDDEDRDRNSSNVMVFSPTTARATLASPPALSQAETPVQADDQAGSTEAEPFDSPAPPLPGPATAAHQKRSSEQTPKKKATKTTKRTDEGGLVGTMQGMIGSIWPKESGGNSQAVVNEFTATYHYTISDYDESFVITGANSTDERLGACGMGTQKDLDPQAASSDKVQVLDVWFYDRADFRTYNQLIVSPAVDWKRLDGKVDNSGTVTGDPLVAAPGVTFKLQGKDLVLDCRIEAVEYLEQNDDYAPFSHVSVLMTVRRKRETHTRSSGS